MPEVSIQPAQSQRARQAFCNATIDSLVAVGYVETSLKRVARVAGFSKGAIQHHFPTKEDLIAATVDELLARTMKPLRAEPRNVAAALQEAWTRYINTPAYLALLEILIAVRTDPQLKQRVAGDLKAWDERLDEQTRDRYLAVSGDEFEAVMLLNMTRSFMRGLLMQEGYGVSQKDSARYVEKWLELIEPLLQMKSESSR